MVTLILLLIGAYLLGSISWAVIVARCFGLPDPRERGSGNPGAKNVWRIGDGFTANLVLIGDMAKGAVPVYLASTYHYSAAYLLWVGLAAVVGHAWPIFFKFKGGIGLATAIGAVLVINLKLGLLLIATALVVSIIARSTIRGAMVATLVAPFYAWFILGWLATIPVVVMAILIEALAKFR